MLAGSQALAMRLLAMETEIKCEEERAATAAQQPAPPGWQPAPEMLGRVGAALGDGVALSEEPRRPQFGEGSIELRGGDEGSFQVVKARAAPPPSTVARQPPPQTDEHLSPATTGYSQTALSVARQAAGESIKLRGGDEGSFQVVKARAAPPPATVARQPPPQTDEHLSPVTTGYSQTALSVAQQAAGEGQRTGVRPTAAPYQNAPPQWSRPNAQQPMRTMGMGFAAVGERRAGAALPLPGAVDWLPPAGSVGFGAAAPIRGRSAPPPAAAVRSDPPFAPFIHRHFTSSPPTPFHPQADFPGQKRQSFRQFALANAGFHTENDGFHTENDGFYPATRRRIVCDRPGSIRSQFHT